MKVRALVIDDSRIMRNMVAQSIRNAGLGDFEFEEAADGLEGLDKFDPKTTDIVFVDWNMPNMSGIEFAGAVRSSGEADHVPIIMITSEGSEKVEKAIVEVGANGYISKPFTVEQIKEKLGPVIEGISRQAGESEETDFFTKLAASG